ncbi:unnamed protein product, partial [Strongylus vulgaris]
MFDENYEKFTQKSPIFNLYVRQGNFANIFTTPKPKSEIPFPTLIHDSALRQAMTADDEKIFDTSNALFNGRNDTRNRHSSTVATTPATSTVKKDSTAPITVKYFERVTEIDAKIDPLTQFREPLVPNSSIEANSNYKLLDSTAPITVKYLERVTEIDAKIDPLTQFREPLVPNSSLEANSNAVLFDPELQQFSDYETIPRLALPSERIAFVNPDKVKVKAECHDTGVNVSFHLDSDEKYTGAVYAAERFEQCRIFLRSSNNFAIFIPRPQHNTWCNALEIDKVVSAVIVMSNDRVLPHDVTTKDDLFFHVTCNYSTPIVDKIRHGIVDKVVSAVIVMSNDRVLPHDVTTKDDLFFHVTCNYSTPIVDKIRHGIVVGGPSPVSITSKELHRHVYLQIMKKGRPVDSVFIGEALVARVESDISPDRLRVMECTAHRVGGSGPPTSVTLITDGYMTCPPNKDRRSRSLAEKHPIRVDHRLIVKARAADSFQKDSRTFP